MAKKKRKENICLILKSGNERKRKRTREKKDGEGEKKKIIFFLKIEPFNLRHGTI